MTGPIETPSLTGAATVELPDAAVRRVQHSMDSSVVAKVDQAADETALRRTLDGMGLSKVSVSDLGALKLDRTLRGLQDELRPGQVEDLRAEAQRLSSAKGEVNSSGEDVGVTGGRAAAHEMGISLYHPSRSRSPGANRVDDIGIRHGEVAVMEYKGLTGDLSSTPVPLDDGRRALQGSSAYVADRLVKDPVVARFFADNQGLWAKVAAGDAPITYYVVQTASAHRVTVRTCQVLLSDRQVTAMTQAVRAVS